jgi:hypothetical protein
MTAIERQYGIPRSTLSGWFKDIQLSESQRTALMKGKQDGWKKAREKAVLAHNSMKAQRINDAAEEASITLSKLEISSEVLDIAFAMLYFGEGAKKNLTSIGNSNPLVLRFVLAVLYKNYKLTPADIRCDLHLRADQDGESMKRYWSEQLNLPVEQFRYIAYDKRTAGKATYEHYKGVCVIACGQIAIQRKLISLYNQFCTKVSEEMGILGA